MQEREYDYYREPYNTGCCLKCPEAKPGCLCYSCKCKKCYWYRHPHESYSDNGSCDKVKFLKEERKKELRDYYQALEKEKYHKLKRLIKINEKIKKEAKQKGIFLKTYTCQKCGNWFISLEDKKIIISKEPRCPICLGE